MPALIVPSYEVESRSLLECVVVDARNEYVYTVASAYAEDDTASAGFMVQERAEKLENRTRAQALDQLGATLMAQLGNGVSATR